MSEYLLDGHKLWWHLDRVHAWQDGQAVNPLYMEVSPVSYCNHRCLFCGVDFARQGHRRLETEAACRALADLGGLGLRGLMFAGEGEPLLHPDLPRMVGAARQAGIDVSITSNGSLGDESLWRELLPQLTWIRFSVDAGSAPVHARVHGVGAKSFPVVVENISRAARVKRELGLAVTIGVQFLVIEENLEDLPQALEVFGRLGVDYFSLKPYSLHPQMIAKRDTQYSEGMIQQVEEMVAAAPASSMQIIFRRGAMQKYGQRKVSFDRCRALPFWAYLDSAGDVYTCSVFLHDERFKAGNIYQESMGRIMAGERRLASIQYGRCQLEPGHDCRVNCRMARINEFLAALDRKPEHVNFI